MTINYKLISGPFAGLVVEEGRQILDVPYEELNDDLRSQVLSYGIDKYFYTLHQEDIECMSIEDFPEPIEVIKESYESSWRSQETDEPVNLTPVSEW